MDQSKKVDRHEAREPSKPVTSQEQAREPAKPMSSQEPQKPISQPVPPQQIIIRQQPYQSQQVSSGMCCMYSSLYIKMCSANESDEDEHLSCFKQ